MLLAYITKKPHRATDGVFCYPLKGLIIALFFLEQADVVLFAMNNI